VRPVVIVIVLPLAQLLVEQVNVVRDAVLVQELVELLVVGRGAIVRPCRSNAVSVAGRTHGGCRVLRDASDRYRKLYRRLWRHPGFLELSDGEKVLAFYLLTGPQTNRLGLYVFSIATAAEDLGTVSGSFTKLVTGAAEVAHDAHIEN
jgi:hypothetical protein